MTRYSRRFAVTLVVAFVGVLAACGDDSAEPAADEPAADGTDSVEGARLVVAFPFEINSTDPRSGLGQNELLPHIHVFDSLLRIAPDGRSLQPRLATDWTITDDPTVWRFSLREDVSFSDGAALDANAVKLSFDRLFDQDAIVPDRDILVNITGVEVVDDMTVEISTSEPNAAIPYAVASPLTSIVSPQTIESFGTTLETSSLPAPGRSCSRRPISLTR